MKRLLLCLALVVSAYGQTASYPSAVVTDSQLKVAANNLTTALRGGISASDTVITVGDASRITASMLLSIEKEIVSVSSVNGNQLTVVRGFDGTTAAAHGSGRAVENRVVAWDKNAMAAEIKAIQTTLGANLANVPANSAVLMPATYNFAPQTPGVSLTGGIVNSITLTPCPLGVAGTDTYHAYYLSGGTGTAEWVYSSGGTCTSGASSGTLFFTPSNSHSGAWTIRSATAGIREALSVLPTGGTVKLPCSSHTIYGPIVLTAAKQVLEGVGYCSVLTEATGANLPHVVRVNAQWNELRNLYIRVNTSASYSENPTAQDGILIQNASRWHLEHVWVEYAGRNNLRVISNDNGSGTGNESCCGSINGHSMFLGAGASGIYAYNTSDVWMATVEVQQSKSHQLELAGSSTWRISNSDFAGAAYAPLGGTGGHGIYAYCPDSSITTCGGEYQVSNSQFGNNAKHDILIEGEDKSQGVIYPLLRTTSIVNNVFLSNATYRIDGYSAIKLSNSQFNSISGNSLYGNASAGSTGYKYGIEISEDTGGSSAFNSLSGNTLGQFWATAPVRMPGLDVAFDSRGGSALISNAGLPNLATTNTRPIPVAFSALGTASGHTGEIVFCNDCAAAATCTGGGTGRVAYSNGSAWVCQ